MGGKMYLKFRNNHNSSEAKSLLNGLQKGHKPSMEDLLLLLFKMAEDIDDMALAMESIQQEHEGELQRLNTRSMALIADVRPVPEIEKSLERLSTIILRNLKHIETTGSSDEDFGDIRPGMRVMAKDDRVKGKVVAVSLEDGLAKILVDPVPGPMNKKQTHTVMFTENLTVLNEEE